MQRQNTYSLFRMLFNVFNTGNLLFANVASICCVTIGAITLHLSFAVKYVSKVLANSSVGML